MNFRFKLSRRLARIKLGAIIAAAFVLGCGLTQAGPVVDRIDHISIIPGRVTLLPFQAAPLTLVVTTSHGDPASPGSLTWSATGGTIVNNGIIAGVPHLTYTAPPQTGTYQIIVVFTETLPGLASATIFLPILLLSRLFSRRKSTAKRFLLTACLAVLVSAVAIESSCGGAGNGPPPALQTHQVTSSGVVILTVQ